MVDKTSKELEQYRKGLVEQQVGEVISLLFAQDQLHGRAHASALTRTFLASLISTLVYHALDDLDPKPADLADPAAKQRFHRFQQMLADAMRIGLENGLVSFFPGTADPDVVVIIRDGKVAMSRSDGDAKQDGGDEDPLV
jgi:hypothetical protein